MDSAQILEIHIVNQRTQDHQVFRLGDTLTIGQADWVLDQTGVEYGRFRFVRGAQGVMLELLEGDSQVWVDGVPLRGAALLRHGSVLRIDAEEFRCELRQMAPQTSTPQIDAGWMTITGSVRPHNEDAIGIFQQPPFHLYVVADGVGGAEAGETISEFAVKHLLYTFEQALGTAVDWQRLFKDAAALINTQARAYARYLSDQMGRPVQAGSTLTALVLDGWEVWAAHVGDSRLYHWREGRLTQLSSDHSTFPSTASPGQMTAGSSLNTTMMTKRNVLMRGIGKSDTIEMDMIRLRALPGDRLLLCSDGMSDRVSDGELAELLGTMPPQRLAAFLAQTADERRSGDNVSVIVVHLGAQPQAAAPPMPQQRAFIGSQPRPRLAAVPDAMITDRSTNTGAASLPLHIIVPLVVIILVALLVGFALVRGAG
jgi:protein phosphatase